MSVTKTIQVSISHVSDIVNKELQTPILQDLINCQWIKHQSCTVSTLQDPEIHYYYYITDIKLTGNALTETQQPKDLRAVCCIYSRPFHFLQEKKNVIGSKFTS